MDITRSGIVGSSLFKCRKHGLEITCIYLKQDNNSRLACQKCCLEYQLDYNYLVLISDLKNMNHGFIIKNFPPGLTEDLQQQLEDDNIQLSQKDKLIKDIDEQFDYFTQLITSAIKNHRSQLIDHIKKIENERINSLNVYNHLSLKNEIINLIFENENNLERLNLELTKLICAKQSGNQNNQRDISDALNKHRDLESQFNLENIKNQFGQILEQIKSTKMLRENNVRLQEIPTQQQQHQYQSQQQIINQNRQVSSNVNVNTNLTHQQSMQQNQIINQNRVSQNVNVDNNLPRQQFMQQNPIINQQRQVSSNVIVNNNLPHQQSIQQNQIINQNTQVSSNVNVDNNLPRQQFMQQNLRPMMDYQPFQQNDKIIEYGWVQQNQRSLPSQQHPYQSQPRQQQQQQQQQLYQQQQLPLEIIQQQQQSNIINQQIIYNPQQPMITQQITIDSLSKLSSITNLPQHLDINIQLYKQQLSQEQVKQLRDALQPWTQVIQIELDLSYSKIGDSGLKMILQSLDQMKHLRQIRLYLSDNNISQEGVQCLAKTLQSYTYLFHLSLGLDDNQNVRDEDVTDLIDIIKCKSTLTYLCLSLNSTNTGDRTVRQLADALKYNLSNLSSFSFSFSYNNIGDDTVIYLTQAIQSIQSKINSVQLFLNRNLIGDRGVQSMINALSNCQNLQTLYLYVDDNKNIGQNGKNALAEFKNKIKSILKKINYYDIGY